MGFLRQGPSIGPESGTNCAEVYGDFDL